MPFLGYSVSRRGLPCPVAGAVPFRAANTQPRWLVCGIAMLRPPASMPQTSVKSAPGREPFLANRRGHPIPMRQLAYPSSHARSRWSTECCPLSPFTRLRPGRERRQPRKGNTQPLPKQFKKLARPVVGQGRVGRGRAHRNGNGGMAQAVGCRKFRGRNADFSQDSGGLEPLLMEAAGATASAEPS